MNTFLVADYKDYSNETVKSSLYLYDKILNNLPLMVYVYDLNEKSIIFGNRSFKKTFHLSDNSDGYSLDFFYSKILAVDHALISERHEMLKGMNDGEIISTEFRIKEENGEIKWLSAKGTPFKRNTDGVITQIIGELEEITERKKLESLLEDVVASSIHGIIIADAIRNEANEISDLKFVLVNESVCSILGIKKSAFRNNTFLQLFPSTVDTFFKKYKEVIETGNTLKFEEYYGFDGFSDWFNVIAVKRQDGLIITFEIINEKKEFLDQLKKQQQLLNETENLAKMGSWEKDMITGQVAYSEQLYEIFGLEKNIPVSSQHLAEQIVKQDLDYVLNVKRKVAETPNVPFLHMYRISTPTGEIKHLEGQVQSYADASGKVVRMRGFVRDITQFKRQEDTLSQTLNQLKESQKLAKMGFWNLDLSSNEFVWSDECCQILGLPLGTRTKYEDSHLYFVDEEIGEIDEKIKKSIAERSSFFSEHRFRRPDGKVVWIMAFGKIVFNENGAPMQLSGVGQDVTERKEAEINLQKAYHQLKEAQVNLQEINLQLEEKVTERTRELFAKNLELEAIATEFKFVTDFMPQLAWATLPNGDHDFFNMRWFDYTGTDFNTSKIIGWQNVLHPDDVSNTIEIWSNSLKTGIPYQIEYRLKRHDGEYRWFLGRALPMINKEGKIWRWFGTCTDIHDQKMMLDQVNKIRTEIAEKNEKLIRINNELDTFVYTASHDLKAPISNIEGLVNALKEVTSYEEATPFIDYISDSISRFKATIKDLTEVAKTNHLDLEDVHEINIPEILQEVIKDNAPLIDKNKASFILDLKASVLYFSGKNFRSILYNLISNAIKYRHPLRNPVITIQTSIESENFIFRISDNGMGLKEEDLSRLFMMFKRFHNHVEGTGVGLYIVKRMLEQSGGKIEVKSQLNEGTTFTIILPNLTYLN